MLGSTLLGLLALGASGTPHIEVNRTIAGRVTDSAGTPLASVRVVVLEAKRSTLTDLAGRYAFRDLPEGRYGVAFSFIGYAPVIRRVILAGTDLTLDVALKRSLVELPTLQVTATAEATTVLTSPQPTAVVEAEDLKAAQAPSLGETLRTVAGVHSLGTGLGIGKPVIRGLSSNRVLVLDNGQRLETAQWGDEHGPNLETATAQRIEVIKGPASVLYGSDALGGVVNVIPRDLPHAGDSGAVIHGSAAAAYTGNNRQPDGSFQLEGASGGFGFRATLSGRTSKDLKTPDYTLWNSYNEAVGGSGTAGFRGAWGSLIASFSQRNEQIGLTDEDPTATPLQRIGTSRGRIDLSLPIGRSRLEADVGYERNRRREFEEKESSDVALGLFTKTWTGHLHFHHPPAGRLNGILGVSGLRTRFDKFGEETLIPNSTATGVGVFAFEQVEVGRWNLSFGARVDQRHLEVEDDEGLGVAAQTRNWTSLTGNFGVSFHVSEPLALVLNVGRGYRAPSTFDLFSNGVHEGTLAFERGNPDLKNETSINTDLALRVQSSRVLLEASVFANFIQNFIYTVPSGETDPESGFEIFDVTQGDARLTGFEVAAQYHPVAVVHLQGTVDYTRGQNTTTGNPLPLIPPFRATYSMRLEGRSKGSWVAPYLMVGGESNARQTRQDPSEAAFYAQAFDGAGYQSRGYTLANAGAGVGLQTGATVFRVDLSVRNLFNKSYADYLNRIKTNARDPGMGRSVTLRLSTDF